MSEHFGRVHTAIINELTDWKTKSRVKGVLLLRNLLVYCEEYCTKQTEQILLAIHTSMSSVNDWENLQSKVYQQKERQIIVEACCHCCQSIGRFVYPQIWIDAIKPVAINAMTLDSEWILILCICVLNAASVRLSEFASTLQSIIDGVNKESYTSCRMQKYNQIDFNLYIDKTLMKLKDVQTESKTTNEVISDTDDDYMYDGFKLEIFDQRNIQGNEECSSCQV